MELEEIPMVTNDKYWLYEKNDIIYNKYKVILSQEQKDEITYKYLVENEGDGSHGLEKGKWMLYFNNENIDEKWKLAKKLYNDDKLYGITSMKCSTNKKNERANDENTKVIILYCDDSYNKDYIMKIGKNLYKNFNYTNVFYYKLDSQTSIGTIATGSKKNHLYKFNYIQDIDECLL